MKRGVLNKTRAHTTSSEKKDAGKAGKRTEDSALPDVQIVALAHSSACVSQSSVSANKYNTTSCVLYFRTLTQLRIQTPQYPSPSNPYDYILPVPYIICETKSNGEGMFATRTLKPRDLFAAERTLIILPVNTNLSVLSDYPQILRGTTPTVMLAGVLEPMLEVALSRMSEEDRKSFMELANAHTENGTPKLMALRRTNVFWFRKLGEDGDKYGAIIKDMSRINHSCRPNCTKSFDWASFSIELRATKLIPAGEEIFYAYCAGMDLSTAQRQAQVSPYGFECTCASCVHSTSNDALRTSLLPRVNDLKTHSQPFMGMNGSTDLRLALALVEESKALLRDLREEGVDGTNWYLEALEVHLALVTTLSRLSESPTERQMWWEIGKKYSDSGCRLYLALEGSNFPALVERRNRLGVARFDEYV